MQHENNSHGVFRTGKNVAHLKMLAKQRLARHRLIESRPRRTKVLHPEMVSGMTNAILQPWHLMVTIMADMVNREQQQTIEYLRTENQVLREKLGKKRIMCNPLHATEVVA